MANLKCTLCGGEVEILDLEKSLFSCTFCDSTITLPKWMDNEKKANLFNNATRQRQNREFDEALRAYERYTDEDDNNSAVHFNIALCRYGIVFEDEDATGRGIPTCGRYRAKSFTSDPNYKKAVELADSAADVDSKIEYERKGREIDEILQKITVEISHEQPYDIFICYKDSDETSQTKTEDSKRGWDLFNTLTGEGYRVFFAARSLRRGDAYEPQIFNALNSAKVMLVIASKFEYVNAVWVKNEWSRFLDIANKDSSKKLFPLYFNMKPEELPSELSGIQAFDMSQYTFFSDLLKDIERTIPQVKAAKLQSTQVSAADSVTVNNLLKRIGLFLEDKDWTSASDYCVKVLDIDAENAMAYLYKLMIELKCTEESALDNLIEPIENNSLYIKAMRFGGEAFKKRLMEHANQQRRNREVYYITDKEKEETYRGTIENLTPNGFGRLISKMRFFEGNFVDGKPDGTGKTLYTKGEKIKCPKCKTDYLSAINLENGTINCDNCSNIFSISDKYEIFIGEYKNGKPINGTGYFPGIDNSSRTPVIWFGTITDGILNGQGEKHYLLSRDEYRKKRLYEGEFLIYKGEFLHGEFNGKGTFHLANGGTISGIFENGFNGNLKYLDKNGKLKYDGGYKNWKRHGKGVLFNEDGTGFQGEWKDGKILSGSGAVVFQFTGDKTIGTYVDGKMQGQGKIYYNSGKLKGHWYEGNFKNGGFNGQGTLHLNNGELITGEFQNGLNGTLKEVGKNGYLKYEGGYKSGKRHGNGILYNSDGSTCQGEWDNGVLLRGQGALTYKGKDGVTYKNVGTFANGNLQGVGQRLILDGEYQGCRYEGTFEKGALQGLCAFVHRDRSKFEAEYVNGVIHGRQRVYSSVGMVMYDTVWKNGKEVGPRKQGTGKTVLDGLAGWASRK